MVILLEDRDHFAMDCAGEMMQIPEVLAPSLQAAAVTLRPARFSDAAMLLEWRNDPHTRAMSISEDIVPMASHLVWLATILADPCRELLIAYCHDYPVGTVRIDRGEETEISWTVAPDWRGRGIGYAMVGTAVPDEPTIAKIKSCNRASQKIARYCGFRCVQDGPVQRWTRGHDELSVIRP